MFTSFSKLVCVVALASTALAQSISFVIPAPGTTFNGGDSTVIGIKQTAAPSWQTVNEVALVIGTSGQSFDGSDLGSVLFQGKFEAGRTDSDGNYYANYSVPVPNWFDGVGYFSLAHYYLTGAYSTSTVEYASVAINVKGSTG